MNYDKGYIRIEDDEKRRTQYRNSLMYSTNYILGICEHIRFIYDSVCELPNTPENIPIKEKLTEQLVDALIMGKKMGGRLVFYKKAYGDPTGHSGTHINRLGNNGARRRMRRARKL
jgi:hypothetical protein